MSSDSESSSQPLMLKKRSLVLASSQISDSEELKIAIKVSKGLQSHHNSDESSSEDEPLALKLKSPAAKKRKLSKVSVDIEMNSGSNSDIDSDAPIMAKSSASSVKSAKSKLVSKKKRKAASSSSESSQDSSDEYSGEEESSGKVTKSVKLEKVVNPKKVVASDKAKPKKEPTAKPDKKEKVKKEAAVKKEKDAGTGEETEEVYKWWEDENLNGELKWTTLSHKGPLFPPVYEPHGVKMKYDGSPITLGPNAEEVASFFAAIVGSSFLFNTLGSEHAANPTFCKNFFIDFLQVIKDENKVLDVLNDFLEFSKCDFTPILDHLQGLKEARKLLTKDEKNVIKAEKKAIDDVFGFCLLDNRKEKVGNYRIEPPGLFRGRGEHPKTGCLKQRVTPEQVTLNIGADADIAVPPAGHSWGSVQHDNTVTWLAMWKENVNDNTKYIFLAANSSLKGQSDMKKFEKARELKKHIAGIRESYIADLKDKETSKRQLATCLYFIDKLALRAGNEKGDEEADTVGCCSLRFEHLTLELPNKVIFDFLGKDSIRYVNTVEVDAQVFKNLKLFKREPKKEGDDLFDRINTSSLNKHLQQFMPGLTAKVFRTYNASITMQDELLKTVEDSSVAEKVLAYNRANREVAVLCNHQRAVAKTHGTQMEKMNDKYDRAQVKKQMLELEPSLKKKRKELLEEESDLDDEFIARHLIALDQKEDERLHKAFIKDNEKRVANGESPLKSRPTDKSKKEQALPTMDKLEKKLITLTERISAQKTQFTDKDENKQTALGTSKINYIDPRITSAWCNKHDVPLEKMFTKTLRDKFGWAMDTKSDFVF